MTRITMTAMRCLAAVLAFLSMLLVAAPAQACSTGGCLVAGPRLASVDSNRGALLNLLMGNLLGGSALTLSVADWNAIATGDLSLLKTLNALQTSQGVSSPTTALTSSVSVGGLVSAMASAATADQKSTLALALGNLAPLVAGISGTVKLGDLLVTDGGLGNTTINALDLITGVVQLYNTKNVLTTPQAITVSGASLGLTGIATNVSLAAQVIEPPVYVCGPVGSTFHTAAMRVKLNLDLANIALDTSSIALLAGVGSVSLKLTKLDLYAEVARGDGTLTAVNALAGTLSVSATPGVVDLYVGQIADAVFFNRTRALSLSDVTAGIVASGTIVTTLGVNLALSVTAKGTARGQAPNTNTLNFTGPYPQSRTAYSQPAFLTNLLSSLTSNLTLTVSGLGVLDAVVNPVLQLVVRSGLLNVLGSVVNLLLNPLLELTGIRLGEMDVQAGGVLNVCVVSGNVYQDANHSGALDANESGTGLALYAKLVPAATPSGPAVAVAPVDPTTGAFVFTAQALGSYTLVVGSASGFTPVTAATPAGWVGTENAGLSNAITLAQDLVQRFGLYRGTRMAGSVFKDTGNGGGTANNGLRDGAETGLSGATVLLTDTAGTTVLDRATTGDQGAWVLWLPYTSAGPVRIAPQADARFIAVGGSAGTTGGSYVLANDATTFTAAAGSSYSGVNFAKVPANKFDTDGQQQVQPGQVAFYGHVYTAGTAGTLSWIVSAPSTSGWSAVLLEDTNCDGKHDDAEPAMAPSSAVTAGQRVCVMVKVHSPANAPPGTNYPVALTARLTYANSTLVGDSQRQDLTLVVDGSGALRLLKTVDKATAATGDVLTYTITYVNQGSLPLGTLKIVDATPAYTVLSAASCGTSPNVALVCTIGRAPAVGTGGRVEWSFTGTLAPGASGTVVMQVLLQ